MKWETSSVLSLKVMKWKIFSVLSMELRYHVCYEMKESFSVVFETNDVIETFSVVHKITVSC